MMRRFNSWSRLVCLLLLLGASSLSLFWVSAQPKLGAHGKGIGFSDYDSKNRISSYLYAGEARPKGDDVEIIDLKAELYAYETGSKATNLVVNASQCLFNQKTKIAVSDKEVQAVSGDGKIKLTGVGFRFEQIDSRVIVSNKVRIEINRDIVVKDKK